MRANSWGDRVNARETRRAGGGLRLLLGCALAPVVLIVGMHLCFPAILYELPLATGATIDETGLVLQRGSLPPCPRTWYLRIDYDDRPPYVVFPEYGVPGIAVDEVVATSRDGTRIVNGASELGDVPGRSALVVRSHHLALRVPAEPRWSEVLASGVVLRSPQTVSVRQIVMVCRSFK